MDGPPYGGPDLAGGGPEDWSGPGVDQKIPAVIKREFKLQLKMLQQILNRCQQTLFSRVTRYRSYAWELKNYDALDLPE